jgi:hypothetical protein
MKLAVPEQKFLNAPEAKRCPINRNKPTRPELKDKWSPGFLTIIN